jgi:hypothetical protein
MRSTDDNILQNLPTDDNRLHQSPPTTEHKIFYIIHLC